MSTLGLSKVFILDKYFTELQKFWETEKKLQGIGLSCYHFIKSRVMILRKVDFPTLFKILLILLDFNIKAVN